MTDSLKECGVAQRENTACTACIATPQNVHCPRCGPTQTLAAGGRLTCSRCGRYLGPAGLQLLPDTDPTPGDSSATGSSGCASDDVPAARPPAASLADSSPVSASPSPPGCGQVLYLSRRLDWFTVPAGDLAGWAAVVLVGSVPYYRLTAGVFVWFERVLLAKADDRSTSPADRAEIGRVWCGVIMPHVEASLSVAEVRAARAVKAELPPVPVLPEMNDAPPVTVPRHLSAMGKGPAGSGRRPVRGAA